MKTIQMLLQEYHKLDPQDEETKRSLSLLFRLPTGSQDLLNVSPQELLSLSADPVKDLPPEDVPDESLIGQVGAILSRCKVKQLLVAIAINCYRETDNRQSWSLRWGAYGIAIRFMVGYINRSLGKS